MVSSEASAGRPAGTGHSPEELTHQETLDRSWRAAQEKLADPEFRAMLEAEIERVRHSTAPTVSAEEFLATTEPVAD